MYNKTPPETNRGRKPKKSVKAATIATAMSTHVTENPGVSNEKPRSTSVVAKESFQTNKDLCASSSTSAKSIGTSAVLPINTRKESRSIEKDHGPGPSKTKLQKNMCKESTSAENIEGPGPSKKHKSSDNMSTTKEKNGETQVQVVGMKPIRPLIHYSYHDAYHNKRYMQ